MSILVRRLPRIGICLIVLGGGLAASRRLPAAAPADQPPTHTRRIRAAAVAGLFYPRDQAALAQMLAALLAGADAEPIPNLKALVCPHAGYQFSGPVAATGFRLLRCRDIRTVFLLAPSHYAAFRGAYVTAADVYRTPLGDVPVSPLARTLAAVPPLTTPTTWRVERPSWVPQSPLTPPAPADDTPETWEHSGEVEIPFLQTTLKKFQLVPIVFGQVDPAAVARVLADRLDDHSLIVASSDLSHYHPYDDARRRDTECVRAICALDTAAMERQEACGQLPILTVMHLAKQKGWKTKLLDYRNSGDTAGGQDAVVGYAAIAFYAPEPEQFGAADRRRLLALARRTLREVVTNQRLPGRDTNQWSAACAAPAGCFVTLTKHGQLRGCIGNLEPQAPLWQAVMANTLNAALRDHRFTPVQTNELAQLRLEISVLTVPQPLKFQSPADLLAKLQPHRDGVVLQIGDRSATYLPQVWAQMPDKETFLDTLAEKAGCAADAWRGPDTRISIYRVESVKESDP